ncbi:MAG: hypothetical protein ACK4ZN_07455 [Oceanibaculum sp.]
MSFLFDIVAPYAQAEIRTAKESAGRLCWRVAGFAAAGLVAALGLGFLALSFHLWLLRHVPAPDAALWTGLMCLAVAGLAILVTWLATRARTRARHREAARAATLAELQLLQLELEQGLRANAKTGTVGMLVAGLVLGASPGLRGALRDLVR